MRKFKNIMEIGNNKRDFKGIEKNLKLTENNFIDNTNRLIYNFK